MKIQTKKQRIYEQIELNAWTFKISVFLHFLEFHPYKKYFRMRICEKW